MVVELDVKLNCMDGVQVTLGFLVISMDVWDGTLSCQDLGHIVVLNVAESLLVIFATSASEIMKIVDQREDASVHIHKFNQGHESVLE
jgi:hypothetical protein